MLSLYIKNKTSKILMQYVLVDCIMSGIGSVGLAVTVFAILPVGIEEDHQITIEEEVAVGHPGEECLNDALLLQKNLLKS